MIIFYILIINCYPGRLNAETCWCTWGRVSQCVSRVVISDCRKFEHVHPSMCSEGRISAQMVVCMCINSLLKEYNIIRVSYGDVGSCIWHQWCQYWKDIKGWMHEGWGFQVADLQIVQVPSHNCRVPQCVLVLACQECSTKREYMFSLLFSMIVHY